MKRKKILVGAASLALIPGFFAVPVLAETAPVNDVIKWDSEYSVKLRQRSYGVQNTTIPTVTDLFNSISLKSYLSAADNFTGNDKAIYKVLHDKFKEVTEGKITDTVFYISVDELKAAGWTVPNTSAYDNRALLAMQKENHDTFWKNLNAIITGLLSDDPLNTAWYDKTVGLATASSEETVPRAKARNFNDYNPGWGYMYFSEKPKESKVVFNGFWVKFGVINEARDKSASEPTYTVKKDSDGMTRIQKALAKAKEIVAEAASMSDIEKIKYYNKKISEMTDYDYDYYGKSVSGQEAPYGGQSMFFNVFDGDESTKVVCEGYSKAFKLLCDLTTWQGKVECNIVTGTMAGGTGAGLHMWNIVTYNGANYLVDTTNSDEGTIGAPDKLILARVGGTYSDVGVTGSVENGYKISTKYSTISYTYDKDTLDTFTKAQLDIGTPVPQITSTPLELTAKLGQKVDNKDLENALAKGGKDKVSVTYNGSTVDGHFEWDSDVTSYGDAGTHTYKCKFVPTSNNYLTVENIDVNVTVKAPVLYSLKYAWENAPDSVTLPTSSVTFEYGTDTTPAAETTFTKGQKVSGEKEGKKGNFIFSGWDEGKADEASKTFTYSGAWTFEANPEVPVVKEFTLSFLPGDGTGSMSDVKVVENTSTSLPANSFNAPAGKEFKAWSIDGKEYQPGDNFTVTKDTQVTALWKDVTPVVKEFTLSFLPGEGSGSMGDVKLVENTSTPLPANSFNAPAGKEFKAWAIDGVEYQPGDNFTPTKDTQVTALWKDVTPIVKEFTLSFLPGDGTGSMSDVKLEENTSTPLPANSFNAPAGKEFKAWDIDGKEYQPGENFTVTKDTQVTAVWKDVTPASTTYKITKGMNSTWEKGNISDLSFTSEGEYSKFLRLELDGNTVDNNNYTSASGSTIVNLKPEYLESLSVGKHTLVFIYNDGKTATAEFTIAKEQTTPKEKPPIDNGDKDKVNPAPDKPIVEDTNGTDDSSAIKTPATGEKSNLAISVFAAIASGAAALGAIVFRRRKS